VKFIEEDQVSSCFMDSFGSNTYGCQIYMKDSTGTVDGYGLGRTVAHECGHMMGADDIGVDPTKYDYYVGLEEFAWYPKMGNYWYGDSDPTNALYQWTKGEYANADNTVDMLAKITRYLAYRSDDIPSTKALTISATTVSADSNRGLIERNTDTDSFTFTLGSSGGSVSLTIDRIEYIGGAMLDVDATLTNSSGTVLSTSNPKASRKATLSASSLAAGTYTLTIKGGAEGTPSNGFSNYSSLGYYGIEGTITGAGTSTGTGGATGAGGTNSTGGTTAKGGSSATGGTTAKGGSSATGGTTAKGGSSATGGTSSLGGTTGIGGLTAVGTVAVGGAAGSSPLGVGGVTTQIPVLGGAAGSVVTGAGGATTAIGIAGATGVIGDAGGDEGGCSCRVARPNRTPFSGWAMAALGGLMLRRRVGHRLASKVSGAQSG
jgi:hypothetical protein